MTHRVLEQVRDDLFHQGEVHRHRRQVGCHLELERHARQEPTQSARARDDELAEVDRLAVRLERAGLDATHAQQVGDEAVEPLRLVADELEHPPGGGLVVGLAARQLGGGGADHRQRRAEVVRDRPEEGTALVLDTVERLDAARHQHADDERDHEEHHQRDDVLGELDARRADRRDQQRVGQRRRRRRGVRGALAAHHRRDDDRDDQRQPLGGPREVLVEWAQDQLDHEDADETDHRRPQRLQVPHEPAGPET